MNSITLTHSVVRAELVHDAIHRNRRVDFADGYYDVLPRTTPFSTRHFIRQSKLQQSMVTSSHFQ